MKRPLINADERGSQADPRSSALISGLQAGRAIRRAVHAMDLAERARRVPSSLKQKNVAVDALAESIGLDHLAKLAKRIDRRVLLLLDLERGTTETIGKSTHAAAVWVCFDAIDGTKKVAGIDKQKLGRLAAANDGAWAATFAFTAPTKKPHEELTIGDFRTAVIVDGNPTRYRSYPQDVIAAPQTFEVDGSARRRLFTSSCTTLNQTWVFLDSFQAFDLDTRKKGDDTLATALYAALINRHDEENGAHDVLRQFGSLSALCRTMLGWREKPVWLESQGGAFIVVNENLPNLLPSVAVIEGAGGFSVDFEGRSLGQRRLVEGRTSVIHAANAALRDRCVSIVARAR